MIKYRAVTPLRAFQGLEPGAITQTGESPEEPSGSRK